jgi:hypothetical protein
MLENFIKKDDTDSVKWGSPIEVEIRNRIKLSVAAYAYEYENDSIMSDAEYDKKSLEIKPKLKTGHSRIDAFFKNNFDADTGVWIRKHPNLPRIKYIYNDYYKR